MNLKNKTALVYDYGMFFAVAERLGRDFGKVWYFTPRESSFPVHHRFKIGEGIPGVERVTSFHDYKDRADLIVFPDVGDGDLQIALRKEGKRVFGCGRGERLELDRNYMRGEIERLGLPIIPFKRVVGVEALKKELEGSKDKYIKISKYRGLGETKHHINWNLSEEWFYQKAHLLGPYRHKQEFIIEDSVDGCEVGADWFFTGGRYLSRGAYGFEVKDKAYVCKVMEHNALPEIIKKADNALLPLMKSLDVRGSVVMEYRVTRGGVAYPIDATQRFGSPPGELLTELWSNFSAIIWAVAQGDTMLAPVPSAKYGAQINLYSEWAADEWTAIKFPDEIKNFVKIKNPCRMDGTYYFIPQDKGNVIGCAIGLGRTLEEAQVNAIENAEQVEAEGVEYNKAIFDRADEYLEKAEKMGVGF